MGSHELRSLIDALDILVESRRARGDELRELFEREKSAGDLVRAAYHNGAAVAIDDFADKVRDMLAQYKRRL